MRIANILTDTHRIILMLKEYGFTSKQAEGITTVFGSADVTELVTRGDLTATESTLQSDLERLRTELKTESAELRTELRTEIAGVKSQLASSQSGMIKWMVGLLIAHAALILTMLR